MKTLVVFSLDQPDKLASQEDFDVVTGMIYKAGLVPRPAFGIYRGQAEKSFIVVVQTNGELELIRAIARAYNQESILTVQGENQEAVLEYLLEDNKVRRAIIGHWCKTETLEKTDLTLDLETFNLYVVRK